MCVPVTNGKSLNFIFYRSFCFAALVDMKQRAMTLSEKICKLDQMKTMPVGMTVKINQQKPFIIVIIVTEAIMG